MYHFIDRLHTLYGLLQDEQSKEVFQARFAVDIDPSIPNIRRLVSLGSCRNQTLLGWNQSQVEALKELNRNHKKIILYGTGDIGRLIARMLEFERIDFYGFCGRNAERFHDDGLFGKPVISPDELVSTGGEYYVVIATVTKKFYKEISEFLWSSNYPQDHILEWADPESFVDEKQYFEFPSLYRRGTGFIDGGCYDCEDSYRFAEWCERDYSFIIAFEPDSGNYAICSQKARNNPLPNFQLVNAGLSSKEGTAMFETRSALGSRIIPTEHDDRHLKDNNTPIRTATIDSLVGGHTVGFIKMDIEGAEFDALHGAKNAILRDKPLLAISVYHLQGDLFAIMDYLHELVPKYRFLLRQYGLAQYETVLYASVDL